MPDIVYAVYKAIKLAVIAMEFGQGGRIPIGKLAKELNVKKSDVYNVLLILVGEGWVLQATKGFTGPLFDVDKVIDTLEANLEALLTALAKFPQDSRQDVLTRIDALRREASAFDGSDRQLADLHGEMFCAFTALWGNQDTIACMVRRNERLYYARMLEHRFIDASAKDIALLGEMATSGNTAELRQMLRMFHAQRRDLAHVTLRMFTEQHKSELRKPLSIRRW